MGLTFLALEFTGEPGAELLGQFEFLPGYSYAGTTLEFAVDCDNHPLTCELLAALLPGTGIVGRRDGREFAFEQLLADLRANPPVYSDWRGPSLDVPAQGAPAARVAIEDVEFAVIDTETTGMTAQTHRVVEVAVVVLDAAGNVLDEYSSLINPNRHMDQEVVRIHGITPAMASTAPPFHLVADDLLARLAGRVWVGHNASFDVRMIGQEFSRLDLPLPEISSTCTRSLASRAGVGSGSLSAVCASLGITHTESHSARGDARACAQAFAAMLKRLREQGARTLADLGCVTGPVPLASWPYLPHHPTIWTRTQAEQSLKKRAVQEAVRITKEALLGSTVCLTGEFVRAERGVVETLLKALGVTVTGSVSKKTQFVFAADPDSLSGKARKARELGVAVLPESALWDALGTS
jgi:DNA polymerase III epsilon subunit family exonuclease